MMFERLKGLAAYEKRCCFHSGFNYIRTDFFCSAYSFAFTLMHFICLQFTGIRMNSRKYNVAIVLPTRVRYI